jgi:hypothetical protein
MERKFLTLRMAAERYGATLSAWRKWAWRGDLGNALVRCGRLVMVDREVLDERLRKTGQLLEVGRLGHEGDRAHEAEK